MNAPWASKLGGDGCKVAISACSVWCEKEAEACSASLHSVKSVRISHSRGTFLASRDLPHNSVPIVRGLFHPEKSFVLSRVRIEA